MRLVVYLVVAVVAFAAGMLIPMAIGGNLNMDAINRALGRSEPPATAAPQEDPLGPLAQKLKEREEELEALEAELEERRARLEQRERELDDTLEQIQEIQARLDEQMAKEDAARLERLSKLADMVAAMDPGNAAEDLEAMAPEDAAEVLLLVKDRTAGSILDEMEPRQRALIHQILQSRRY